MRRLAIMLSLAALWAATPLRAQVPGEEPSTGRDASQQVEESDEAFRRRMELEDARYRDPTYVDPQDGYKRELEKIDRLPEASRDHIREQLIDLIMENGEWSPEDARREYPYRPSAAAQEDKALASREQEAWDEQIEKYHAREAAAFGAYRGPAPGPGNPDDATGEGQSGQDGEPGQEGQSGEDGESGQEGQAGQQGAAGSTAGTYEPYRPNRQTAEEGVSTAGVSESALDFILGQRGAPDASGRTGAAADQPAEPPAAAPPAGPGANEDTAADEAEPDLRGILAIEDLDKLGDSVRPPPPPEAEEEDPPPDDG